MKKRLHYGWIICGLCVLTLFCTMGLTSNTFSVYINAFIDENGFSRTAGSSLTTIRCLGSVIGMICTGAYYRKLNMKKGLSLSVVMVAAAFFIYSRAHALYVFYIGAFIAGLGYGIGTMIPITILLNRWFIKRRGTALGIVSAGTGLATIIVPPLISAGLNFGGVAFVAFVEGALILIYAVIMFFLLRNDPKDKGLLPFGASEAEGAAIAGNPDATATEEMPDAAATEDKYRDEKPMSRIEDLLLLFALFLLGAASTPALESLAVHLTTSNATAEFAAVAVSVCGIFMMAGKFIFGWLVDAIGIYKSNYIFSSCLIIGLFLAYFADGSNPLMCYIFVAFLGFGLAMNTVGISVWPMHFYHGERSNSKLRQFWIATLLGALTFTSVPGFIADRTGSYRLFYVCAGLAFILIMIIVQTLIIRRKRAGSWAD